MPNDFELVRFNYDPLDDEIFILEDGDLRVSAGNKYIAVYTVDGRLILKAKGELRATLKKGVYKVLIGKEKRTIIIR
ncbi:MAG: hypothetical protein ACO2PO_21830 [Candidatus Calescibacterium sp.]